jgi:hypothetical protein
MNSSMLFEENSNNELLENFLKLSKISKNFNKELKKVKQEKEYLIIKLSESHALIDSLKSENTMLFNTIDTLENKLKESEDILKKLCSDNLKSILCIHTDISNKPDLNIDDLSASTAHASDSEVDSIVIKSVIIDTACLDNVENFCLNNCVKLNSKELGTQGKFVSTCRKCGNVGHIRLNCYLLKSHRPLTKQVAPKKGKIENTSSDKYVTSQRRHLSQDFVLCKNANPQIAEHVKKHISKQRQPTCHHSGVTEHIRPHCHQIRHQKPRIKKQEAKTGKSNSKPSKPYHASRQKRQYPQRSSPSCRHNYKNGYSKAEYFRAKPHKPKEIQTDEGLVNMMNSALVRLINLDMAYYPASQVEKVWIKKDETIYPLRGSGLT